MNECDWSLTCSQFCMKFARNISQYQIDKQTQIHEKRLYLCRTNAKKKLNYNFSSSKTHLLVYWIWERGNEFSLWEKEKNSRRRFKNEHAHIFSCCIKWAICHEQKKWEKKNCADWKYMQNWLIFLSFHRRRCRHRHHHRQRRKCVSFVSFRFDAVWFGMIFVWFTPFNHLLEMESINWIRRFPWNWFELYKNAAHNFGFDRLVTSTKY